jgi:hypothetical protein
MSSLSNRTGRAAAAALAGAIAAVAAIAYVVAPPKGLDDYRQRAAASAKTLDSQVQTADLWSEVADQGRATTQATLVGLEEAHEDATSAASEFEGFNAPAGAAALRSRFVTLAAEAIAALDDLHAAARQGHWDDLPGLSARLPALSDQLVRFEERAEP